MSKLSQCENGIFIAKCVTTLFEDSKASGSSNIVVWETLRNVHCWLNICLFFFFCYFAVAFLSRSNG